MRVKQPLSSSQLNRIFLLKKKKISPTFTKTKKKTDPHIFLKKTTTKKAHPHGEGGGGLGCDKVLLQGPQRGLLPTRGEHLLPGGKAGKSEIRKKNIQNGGKRL